jgi:molybdopterin/thiamine biosynthesis adenylyltransferase
LKVSARIPSIKEVEVNVSPNTTVARLKQIICNKLGLEENLTRLLLKGKPLNEKTQLTKLKLGSEKLEVDYFWSRQMILWGEEGQANLRDSRALIIGAGAIGNEAAKNLAMLGIRNLTIVDYDTVEVSNLNRMIFFDKTDSGRPKSRILAEKLHRKYPHLEITAVEGRLEKLPINVFLDSDVILSGLDNFASRVFLTSISRRYLVPMVDGGIAGYQCRVQTYIPPDDPCPLCPVSSSQYGKLVGLRNPCDAPIADIKIPSLPTTISLVASIQTQEVVKVLLGYKYYLENHSWPEATGKPLEGIWIADLKYNKYSTLKLVKNRNCLVCGEHGEAKDIVIRTEIPLTRLVSPAARGRYLRSIFPDSEDFLLFKIAGGTTSKLTEESMRKDTLKKGDYLLVTLKRRSGEYSEAIAQLT